MKKGDIFSAHSNVLKKNILPILPLDHDDIFSSSVPAIRVR